MKRSTAAMAGLLVLVTYLAGTGCAPMPYQGPYYPETEVIIIYEPIPIPVPYPVPGDVCGSEPLPPRHTPLKKPRDSGNPRIKTPRGGRSEDPPVIARGGDKPVRKPRKSEGRPSKKRGMGRR